MATVIQIKRSSGTSAPSTLKLGELAYTYGTGTQGNLGDRLFIGEGGVNGDGNANNITVIGGQYFTDQLDHAHGTLTASSALLVDSNKAIDEIFIGNSTSTGGTLKLNEGTDNGSNFVALKAPNNVASNLTLTLPGTVTDGYFLKTDGSGNLEFAEVDTTISYVDDSSTVINVASTESVKFAGGTGLTSTASGATITFDLDDTAVSAGSYGSTTAIPTFTVDAQGRLTAASTVDVATTLTIADDSSTTTTINLLGDTLQISGGEGIDTTISGDTITISAEDATTSNKGVASFATADFGVSSGEVSLDDAVVKTVTTDSGALTPSSHGFSILGGEGMDVTHTGTTITVAGEDATDSNKGIASFDSTDFSVSSGAVSIAATTLGSSSLNPGETTTAIAGLTEVTIDNININGNTISTTDTDGDLILSPNGSGDIDANSSKIINVTDPTSDQDAATKAYVDSVANGLDVKDSVRVATTANLSATYNNGAGTLTADANGAISVDGVSLSVNDRILVKDQTTQTQNGVYKVTNTGGVSAQFVLTRTPDADQASEITGGAFTFVEEGTANADNGYVFTHNGTPTLGTTNITVAQFSGAGQISAGDALTKTGNTLDVAVDDSSIEVSSDALQVKALGITNAMLAGSIANDKLAGSIANDKLANSTVSFTDDSSTSLSVALGQSLRVLGGEGIDATISAGNLNIIGELATTSNKGVASFSSDNFTVTSGAVTVTTIDGGTF